MADIVLASASPRRRRLLRQVVDDFEVDPADINEERLTVADPFETAQALALAKAKEVERRHYGKVIIGSDTVVAVPNEDGTYLQLAKPYDEADARRMIGLLQGRSHLVITGVAIVRGEHQEVFFDKSVVTFSPLSEAEIAEYVARGESMDKAGAYGIQGMASKLVKGVEGSLDNVVGLPTERLEIELEKFKSFII